MRIAVTSQNLKGVTPHAGKCRRFWIYETASGVCLERRLVEIPLEESFHIGHRGLSPVLAGIDVLITGSMGDRLYSHLRNTGIVPVVTCEESPDIAVTSYLSGNMRSLPETIDGRHEGNH